MIRLANARSAGFRSGAKNHTQQPNTLGQGPVLQTRLAFTLIELLVVIAIIALLAALLLPTLSRAKARAKAVACMSNAKQLGLALRLYVDDFGTYPPFVYMTPDGNAILGTSWYDTIHPYCGSNKKLLWCPGIWHPPESVPAEDWPGTDYGYNAFGTGRRWSWDPSLGLGESDQDPVPESRVRVPADMIAIGEIWEFGWGIYFYTPVFPPGAYRHGKRFNAALCDGHVESSNPGLFPIERDLPGSSWWRLKPDDAHTKRFNNDNQPHSETWR